MNFKRAALPVLREVFRGLLSERELAEIIALRERTPGCTVEDVLAALKPPLEKSLRLRMLLTDYSRCHSLWIVAAGKTRSWHSFYVAQGADALNDAQEWSFEW